MLEKCLLFVCGMAAGAYIERRRVVNTGLAILKSFGSISTTKNEEPKTESETEKSDN